MKKLLRNDDKVLTLSGNAVGTVVDAARRADWPTPMALVKWETDRMHWIEVHALRFLGTTKGE